MPLSESRFINGIDMDTYFGDPIDPNKKASQSISSSEPIVVEGFVMGRPNQPKEAPVKIHGKKSTAKIAPKKVSNASRSPGLGDIETVPDAPLKAPSVADITQVNSVGASIDKQTEFMEDTVDKGRQAKLLEAGARFFIDTYNANNAYNAQAVSARLNILEARRQASGAIERGRQRALEAQVEGIQAGEDTLLSMAAQGQNVQGSGAQKAQKSLEDIGLYNALQEDIKGINEALGFEFEEIAINYELKLAEIERDATILSSAVTYGAKAYAYSL